MSAIRRRTYFAAPFIVVVGCGGKPVRDEPTRELPGPAWTVQQHGAYCDAYVREEKCPRGALCNPPPPRPIACPSGMEEGRVVAVVEKPDHSCAIVPSGCLAFDCATAATPCPHDDGAAEPIAGPMWTVTRQPLGCTACVDDCKDPRAIACPAADVALPARVGMLRSGRCAVIAETCHDTSCAGAELGCPLEPGKDLPPSTWNGERQDNACTVRSRGPIAGERVQKIVCPAGTGSGMTFRIDRDGDGQTCRVTVASRVAVPIDCPE